MTDNMDSQIDTVPVSRLEYFPISMFTIAMGFGGLALAYEKLAVVSNFPSLVGTLLSFLVLMLFTVIFSIYLLKVVHHLPMVKAEFNHPIKINFFPTISISLLLLAGCFSDIQSTFTYWLWLLGTSLHLGLTFYIISTWLERSLEVQLSNPAWFIPVMGNVIVPITAPEWISPDILIFFLSIGLFLWVSLFTIIFYRLVFYPQLPEKFIPTLFIFIAPPAVIFIAYYKITNDYDLFAQILYNLSLFFVILLLFMLHQFTRLRFYLSWWAFTFPLAAITIATLLHYQITQQLIFWYLGLGLLIITTFVVLLVASYTIHYMLKGDICVYEK